RGFFVLKTSKSSTFSAGLFLIILLQSYLNLNPLEELRHFLMSCCFNVWTNLQALKTPQNC
ncbi:MAG: hypothetical protein RQ756_09985, partial [Flavobacteriaceae bacterium]|nr:hypothetical protein [Flavobacteriaceae bacterium]